MKRTGPKQKTGRKLLPIDPRAVEGMASVGATDREIGAALGCDGDTIGRRFAEILEKARANLRLRLRQRQLRAALDGNVVMMIWLGKQMLDQTDRQELTGKDGAPLLPPMIRVQLVRPAGDADSQNRLALLDRAARP